MANIVELNKGAVTTAHSAIAVTTTSSAIDTRGYNAVLVHVDITDSGAWTIKIQGALTPSDTYVDWYDSNGVLMSTGSISADQGIIFVGIPDTIKVVATEDTNGATLTVKVQPIVV